MTIVRSLRADMDERDRSISRVQTIKATLADAQDRGEMATVRMYEAELKIAKTTVIDSMVRENKGGTVVGKCERRERSVCGGESDRVWCAHHVCLSTQKKTPDSSDTHHLHSCSSSTPPHPTFRSSISVRIPRPRPRS